MSVFDEFNKHSEEMNAEWDKESQDFFAQYDLLEKLVVTFIASSFGLVFCVICIQIFGELCCYCLTFKLAFDFLNNLKQSDIQRHNAVATEEETIPVALIVDESEYGSKSFSSNQGIQMTPHGHFQQLDYNRVNVEDLHEAGYLPEAKGKVFDHLKIRK